MHKSKAAQFGYWIATPTALLLGGLLMFATLQRQLIYFPSVAAEPDQLQEAAAVGLKPWRDEDGALIGWHSVADRPDAPRMLVFHGNAGYALHRSYFVQGFQSQGWKVYLFEYPGYGARSGTPSEDDIKNAATGALELLLGHGERPLYLAGESLGSGVASYLAASHPQQVKGLLLITPFTALTDVAAHHYPYLPVRTLMRERYDSVAALTRYRGPAAFLLAGSDEVVPVELGRELHDGFGGAKWLRVEPGAGHNSLPYHPDAPWWGEVSNFLLSATIQ